ncbi:MULTISPECIES: nucleoside-diphosphate kinase [unclassified Candidatus Frackibacter]|uniref:nucleoside-diphosphate kinase n=1 Tax=unclassified Candidatus Frackibacter TaxID=2648818 RepID=UPI00087E3955|nr:MULTISPECIES: nucleoside-diphosphate kinase [unclassified Candidatus Frackibacter]SDC51228.1 nucleoside diphosphate kinase [Candidatus Frackibacter sp. WG11]SEM40772.1 nucleoside diphosphate kinase [Candidatus Frackibacter sp. WG12]SFL75279.1 nucleoside diphosphate kinase [Candidatus Frackibacter sp. WG13]
MEQTFFMIKPDGVKRNLVGKVVSRVEERGLNIKAMKMLQISDELAKEHYAEHVDKPFFPDLKEFITSGPVVAMVVEGAQAIKTVRNMMGATDPFEAKPGTIRGDYALIIDENVVHGSDSQESAEREINLFFTEDELV